jgi:aldehyde:ferredoxin oxidoreductase
LRKFAAGIGVPEDQIEKTIPNEVEVEYTPRLNKWVEDYNVMLLNLGLCNRPPYQQILTPETCAEIYEAVTGITVSPQEVLRSGERAQNMERLFNCREGHGREEDRPPQKWISEPTWVDGRKIDPLMRTTVERMLDYYYEERGWNWDGVPSAETLDRLELNHFDRGNGN